MQLSANKVRNESRPLWKHDVGLEHNCDGRDATRVVGLFRVFRPIACFVFDLHLILFCFSVSPLHCTALLSGDRLAVAVVPAPDCALQHLELQIWWKEHVSGVKAVFSELRKRVEHKGFDCKVFVRS